MVFEYRHRWSIFNFIGYEVPNDYSYIFHGVSAFGLIHARRPKCPNISGCIAMSGDALTHNVTELREITEYYVTHEQSNFNETKTIFLT